MVPVRDREKVIETGDGQIHRTRKGGGLWKLFRENTKTFLNVTFGMLLASVNQLLAVINLTIQPAAGQISSAFLKFLYSYLPVQIQRILFDWW